MAEQLPLQFEHRFSQSFANFYPGNNQETIDHLKRCVAGTGEQQIYLWGSKGMGKSHLLQASSQLAQALGKTAFYYSFTAQLAPDPGLLDGLDGYQVVCFDDIEAIAGHSAWEHGFFNFYNRHRDRNHRLILASDCPPNWLLVELPDLKTRLNWGLTLKLKQLSDDDCIKALMFKARQLGFSMNPKIGRYLLNHYAHDLDALWHLLDRLDRETLAAKRKLTLPFVKTILNQDER